MHNGNSCCRSLHVQQGWLAGDQSKIGTLDHAGNDWLGMGRGIAHHQIEAERPCFGQGAFDLPGAGLHHLWYFGISSLPPGRRSLLRIEVNQQNLPSGLSGGDGKIGGDRGFACPAFLADDSEDA